MSVFLQRIEAKKRGRRRRERVPFGLLRVRHRNRIHDRRPHDARCRAPGRSSAHRGGRRATEETEQGEIAWSNELALHVIEVKTNGPRPRLDAVVGDFQRCGATHQLDARPVERPADAERRASVDESRSRYAPVAARNDAVYRAYDRIFGCQGHGWSNLQSMHINLPFKDDAEFGRLHAAIRVLLPICRRSPRARRFSMDATPASPMHASTCTRGINARALDHRSRHSGAGAFRSAVSRRDSATDVPRHRAARHRQHSAVRMVELARRHRALRPSRD